MLDIWGITWVSGVFVHFAAWESFTRKQAITTMAIQCLAALIISNYAEVLAPAGGILVVNIFHIISFWVVWQMRKHDKQAARQERAERIRRLKEKWPHLP